LLRDSVPRQAERVSFGGCGRVDVETGAFGQCKDLSALVFDDVPAVSLAQHFFAGSKEEEENGYRSLVNLTISSVARLELGEKAFEHFPRVRVASFRYKARHAKQSIDRHF